MHHFALVAVVVLLAGAQSAQTDWLPPRVAEALAAQFAERMPTTDPTRPADSEALLTLGREMVQKFRRQLDAWGEKGVLQRTPKFAQLSIPSASQPHLDALARQQVCNIVLMLQFEGGADPQERQAAALGLSAMTMIQLSMRQPYLAQGGQESRIEPFLTSSAMARMTDGLQDDGALIQHAKTECGPILREMVAALQAPR